MAHETEADFEDEVAHWFEDQYGEEAVETQVWLPDVQWYCDIVVETGWATIYCETESRASEIRPGIGQAVAYAATDQEKGIPIVVVPAGHTDENRIETLRRSSAAVIREFDSEDGGWV